MARLTIFSRPDWSDLATRWGTYWTKFLETLCPTEVIDLYQELARKAPNEEAIKAHPKSYYYFFGHGADYCIAGQENEYIVTKDNIALWKDACVHALSCSVFKDLGLLFPDGSGYKDIFYFYVSEFPNSAAGQYFRSDHQYFEAIWRGNTRGEAQKALKDKFAEYYAQNNPGRDYLLWDASLHVITGDPNGRPEEPTGIKTVTAYYVEKVEGIETKIGEMTAGPDNLYTLKWKFPREGEYSLIYFAEDAEGNIKRKETGDFTIKFPESPIDIIPIWPVGGETIEARSAEIKVQVRYLGK